MWNELTVIDYEAVRSTAWYEVVQQRREQDLERQLCQAASGRPGLRPVAWLSRWLAGYRAARHSRLAKRKDWEWAHRTMVL